MKSSCQQCGDQFDALRSTAQFCSEKCKKAHQRDQAKSLNIPKPAIKTCKLPSCGKPFTPENPKGEFCSVAHRVAYHRLVKLGEKLVNQVNESASPSNSMMKKVAKKPGSGQPEDQPPDKSWSGPRQWVPDMEPAEVTKRLHAMRAYRQWAQARGLNHMVVTREQVEGLLKQVGANPRLADIVFPITDGIDKSSPIKKVGKKPVLQLTEDEQEEDPDGIP